MYMFVFQVQKHLFFYYKNFNLIHLIQRSETVYLKPYVETALILSDSIFVLNYNTRDNNPEMACISDRPHHPGCIGLATCLSSLIVELVDYFHRTNLNTTIVKPSVEVKISIAPTCIDGMISKYCYFDHPLSPKKMKPMDIHEKETQMKCLPKQGAPL